MELSEALKEHFGYDTFRKGQEAIVRSVLSGRPTIAILPTGGGKSLCYQLPALLLEGTTVVVSPLVALMKDQVDALRARAIAATFVNSSLPESERQERQSALRRGEYRLVYVAPERFKSPSFLSAMGALKVPLLAVDEAHCISAWGHDFRPEYQQIARAREQLRAERVLALTATATPEVRRDIADALELRDPRVFVAGFDRPNLFIEVLRVSGDKDKLGRLVALSRSGGPGIVYAATRKNVEKVVGVLRASEIDAVGYHAGMADAERTAVQERFVRGEARVIVATNAFGMGVDKADIRFVAHFDVPRSLEAYYQEIGRAGRDGLGSHALLLFNFADVMMQRRMIEAGRPSRDLVEHAWEAARALLKGSMEEVTAAPRKRKQTEAPSADDTPYDQQVFEKLRALRTELARETRVPPYVVFHDATLRELARALPQDEKGFLAVKGAGPGRWQRYGERVVAITRQSPPAETTPVVSEPRSQPELCFGQPRARRDHPSPTDYGPAARVRPATELWALCASGATLADLSARLGRSAGDIASDLSDGVQQGKILEVSRLPLHECAIASR